MYNIVNRNNVQYVAKTTVFSKYNSLKNKRALKNSNAVITVWTNKLLYCKIEKLIVS